MPSSKLRNGANILLIVFIIPAIAAAFLPKAIYLATQGNFGQSWAGFTLTGIFFMMGIAGFMANRTLSTKDSVQEASKASETAE